MDLKALETSLGEIFGSNNVKPHSKGFRLIIEYENMPYCVVLRTEDERLVMDKDAVDEDQANYDEAYKKAYKMLLLNKDKFNGDIDI